MSHDDLDLSFWAPRRWRERPAGPGLGPRRVLERYHGALLFIDDTRYPIPDGAYSIARYAIPVWREEQGRVSPAGLLSSYRWRGTAVVVEHGDGVFYRELVEELG